MMDVERIGKLARVYEVTLKELRSREILDDAEVAEARKKIKAEIKKELGLNE